MESNWRCRVGLILAVVLAVGLSPAWGADKPTMDPMPMNPVMDSAATAGMSQNTAVSEDASGMENTEGMEGMEGMGQGVSPVEPPSADPRDPDAYADGYDFGPIPRPRFADEDSFASLLVDRLEVAHTSDGTAWDYDLKGWYGRDYDRAVFKAEGDVDGGTLQDARTELLWSHATAPFWDMQLGARYDSGTEPAEGWLAFAVQGLAPYWFEIDVAGYLGTAGRSAARLDAEYELLFTQRWVLQPRLEANFYGKDDAERALGSGLSDLAAGIRLRYEIRREIAPYVGVEWAGKYGGTADYARAAGEATAETRWLAGVRLWF